VAAVQYTFTHKQYTEQHNETEYTNGTYIAIRTHKEYITYTIKQKHTKHTTICTVIQNRTKSIWKNVINQTAV